MNIGLDIFDYSFDSLENGKLYCVVCTSHARRLNLLAQVAVCLLTQQNGMAIISLDYNKTELVQKLKESYKTLGFSSQEKLSLWVEYQPITTFSLIQDTLQRIVYRDKNGLQVLIIENLIKIRTDFQCPSADLRIAANLYLLKMLAVKYKIPVIAFAELYPDTSLQKPLKDCEYIDKMVIFYTRKEQVEKIMSNNTKVFSISQKIKRTTQKEIPFSIEIGKEIINKYSL